MFVAVLMLNVLIIICNLFIFLLMLRKLYIYWKEID